MIPCLHFLVLIVAISHTTSSLDFSFFKVYFNFNYECSHAVGVSIVHISPHNYYITCYLGNTITCYLGNTTTHFLGNTTTCFLGNATGEEIPCIC